MRHERQPATLAHAIVLFPGLRLRYEGVKQEEHMDTAVFWAIVAAMTLGVGATMARALTRARAEGAAAYDLGIYRDQLREVERDLERGVISTEEAERLRAEIGRRVLAADQALQRDAGAMAGGKGQGLAIGVMAMLLLGAGVGSYWAIGAPGFPDLPLQARLAESDTIRDNRMGQAEAEQQAAARLPANPAADPRHVELMERLRTVMAERPNDLQGQELLARNEAMLGNFAAAWQAQRMVVALKGPLATADDLAIQAELMVLAADGFVSPEAEALLAEALARDRGNPTARYYSGLMFAQIDRPDMAFRFWAPLWAESTEADPWVGRLRMDLPAIAWRAGEHRYELPELRSASRGPDAATMEAAAEMSAEERAEMVGAMVEGLAERLGAEGGPAADWAQLIRALGVLGQTERAAAIRDEALQTFDGRTADLDTIRAAARDAGLTE